MTTEEAELDERTTEKIRSDVREWLGSNWSAGQDRQRFLEGAVDAGWARPAWPRGAFGRDLPEAAASIITEEFRAAGAPVPQPDGNEIQNAIATTVIKDFAESPVLRENVLRELLTGRHHLCLLYSEPGAGSDLAALQTNAERDGDEWVINGQKVWTSEAQNATYGLLAARTNWDVPKRHGITYFLIPLDQEGVDIRPIKQMTGHAHFNEVFLTNARVEDRMRISAVDDGWRVLQRALAVERMVMGTLHSDRDEDNTGLESSEVPRLPDLVAIATEAGRNKDPLMRQEIARLHALRRIGSWNAERAEGQSDMGVATVIKLALTTTLHDSARIHAQLIGQEAMLVAGASAAGDAANQAAMWQFAHSIGGGSDEIQRNLIAERILGLPHDHSADRHIPFREARKAEAIRKLS